MRQYTDDSFPGTCGLMEGSWTSSTLTSSATTRRMINCGVSLIANNLTWISLTAIGIFSTLPSTRASCRTRQPTQLLRTTIGFLLSTFGQSIYWTNLLLLRAWKMSPQLDSECNREVWRKASRKKPWEGTGFFPYPSSARSYRCKSAFLEEYSDIAVAKPRILISQSFESDNRILIRLITQQLLAEGFQNLEISLPKWKRRQHPARAVAEVVEQLVEEGLRKTKKRGRKIPVHLGAANRMIFISGNSSNYSLLFPLYGFCCLCSLLSLNSCFSCSYHC